MVRCGCRRSMSRIQYERHIVRYKIGRFQCAVCLRRFPMVYRLSQHQKDTCHTGTNELDTDGSECDYSSVPCYIILELTRDFKGLSLLPLTDMYRLNRANLESFVADNVQADSLFRGCCGEVIDQLVRNLQDKYSAPKELRPRRIIKSGSLGKGTAVKGRSDIDLILMLVEYDDIDVLLDDLGDLLSKLETYLKDKTTAIHKRTTKYSVQVEVTCRSGHQHDVDILPAVDLLELDYDPTHVYRKMERVKASAIHEYSVTLAPLQIEIIGALPPKVKSLIKLLKYWKYKKLKPRKRKRNLPSSYALELVVLNAWIEAKEPGKFDMARALHAVLTSLVNHEKFMVVFDGKMKYSRRLLTSRSIPYIMDPANPFNDMYHGLVNGNAFDWDAVALEARLWLSKPLFDVVTVAEKSWS